MHDAKEHSQSATGLDTLAPKPTLCEDRLRSVEADTGNLERRVKRIEMAMLGESLFGRGDTVATRPNPAVALGFTTIDVQMTADLLVNGEEPVTFTVKEFPGGKLLDCEPVTVTITGTTTGSIANAPAGSPKRQVASLGTKLKLTTNASGEAMVYILGTTAESFSVTGIASAGTFQPSDTVKVTVT